MYTEVLISSNVALLVFGSTANALLLKVLMIKNRETFFQILIFLTFNDLLACLFEPCLHVGFKYLLKYHISYPIITFQMERMLRLYFRLTNQFGVLLLAINRFAFLLFPIRASDAWTKRTTIVCIVIQVCAALFLSSVILIPELQGQYHDSLGTLTFKNPKAQLFYGQILLSVTFFCNLATVVMYIACAVNVVSYIRDANHSDSRKAELQFLVQALGMFIIQFMTFSLGIFVRIAGPSQFSTFNQIKSVLGFLYFCENPFIVFASSKETRRRLKILLFGHKSRNQHRNGENQNQNHIQAEVHESQNSGIRFLKDGQGGTLAAAYERADNVSE